MTKFDFGSVEKAFEADWPVAASVPQDGGQVEEQTFTVRFKLLTDEEFDAVNAHKEPAKELIRRSVVGFGKEESSPFSTELLEKMLARGYLRIALNKAYGNFSMGIAAKN